MDNYFPVIDRTQALARIRESYEVHSAVAIEGPRQCGKTTLAHTVAAGAPEVTFFDLERPADLQKLASPEQTLRPLRGLVVIDEAQRVPELAHLWVVYPGWDRYRLNEKITAVPAREIPALLAGLKAGTEPARRASI
jgi:predicted AAA+ superfamily ATPase